MSGYRLTGTLLDACQCGVLCPCWLGEDPDEGEHHSVNAYHIDTGHAAGVDVSGLSLVNVVFVPGNVLVPESWRIVRLVDDRGTDAQRQALLRAFRGELGGPLASLAHLVGEEVAVETVPISHTVSAGFGKLSIPGLLETAVEPFRGPDGSVTTLRDGIFSTVPEAPAWVAKASMQKVCLPSYGMVWEYRGRNAIQTIWSVQHLDGAASEQHAGAQSGRTA